MKSSSSAPLVLSFTVLCSSIFAQPVFELDKLEVKGRGTPLVGEAISASQGVVGRVDLDTRPMLRVGEVLEMVPGMIATQHSGSGKANQYFLRGFNLDHGTDFATWVDGMPVNMVSHGHGQGYTDLNFLIPELIDNISYLKGSYYSSVGDFSSAGSASIETLDTVENGIVKMTVGEDENYRFVVANQWQGEKGVALYGFERETDDGPWDLPEDLEKVNAYMKFYSGDSKNGTSLTFMAYDGTWNSTDQIPERTVESGLISDLGFLDDSVGGESSRYSVSIESLRSSGDAHTQFSAYAIYYDMNLWSNFTYFLDDPISGDQFEQEDQRIIYGLALTHDFGVKSIDNKDLKQRVGLQLRYDDISNVGLYRSVERRRISTTREDAIDELAVGVFYDSEIALNENFRANFGVRGDWYHFDVASDLAENSGSANEFLVSPKLNLVYQVGDSVEMYGSFGYGFHSNDARGTTISIDPVSRENIQSVDPLVKSKGAEIGARFEWNEKLNTSVSLWELDLDSELLFVGDAGNTEASRPSHRSGIEFANYFKLSPRVTLDFDFAVTDAAFQDLDPAGFEVPGAIDRVASLGVNYSGETGWFGSLRFRHFGERPLLEDNSVRSDGFESFNLRFGYRTDKWRFGLDVLNLLDSADQDISYYYESRLAGEPAEGVEDIHYHRIPPRAFKASFEYFF